MPLPKVEIKANPEELVLLIDGFVHLYLFGKRKGIDSYHEDCYYCIDWHLEDYKVTTQYADKKLWLKILTVFKMKIPKIK